MQGLTAPRGFNMHDQHQIIKLESQSNSQPAISCEPTQNLGATQRVAQPELTGFHTGSGKLLQPSNGSGEKKQPPCSVLSRWQGSQLETAADNTNKYVSYGQDKFQISGKKKIQLSQDNLSTDACIFCSKPSNKMKQPQKNKFCGHIACSACWQSHYKENLYCVCHSKITESSLQDI